MENWAKIPINIYRCGVLVFFGSRDKLTERLRTDGVPKSVVREVNRMINEAGDFAAVTLPLENDMLIYAEAQQDADIIIHELAHATFGILKKVGIDASECEEAYAYLLEYLYGEVNTWLTK